MKRRKRWHEILADEEREKTMSKGDGKNLKFRVLCKKCNSYQHTAVYASNRWGGEPPRLYIVCDKCGNSAESLEEEA
jgi:RNase P subunit RPR2